MKAEILFILGVTFVILFGCTVSINPQDLAPSKNYAVVPDVNTGSLDQNNAGSLNSSGSTNASGSPGSSASGSQGTTQNNQITLTAAEVAKHKLGGNCWMIINNKVYDLSQYVDHPGGSIYLDYCGIDGTNGYNTMGGRRRGHSSYADALLANYFIGTVGQTIVSKVQ